MDGLPTIESVDVADAEGRLEALLVRVERGERICLTRDGRPVAWLTAASARPRPSRADLDAITAQIPYQTETAGEFIRRLRDDERY